MKVGRRIAVIAAREVQRFAALAAERAALPERIRKQRPRFRLLADSEAERSLGTTSWRPCRAGAAVLGVQGASMKDRRYAAM